MMGPDLVIYRGLSIRMMNFMDPPAKLLTILPEGIEAVRFYTRNHYNQIKLYSSIDTGWIRPMASQAHKLGMSCRPYTLALYCKPGHPGRI